MAFTAKVTAVQKAQGHINVAVEYTDGTTTFGDTFTSSGIADMNWLKSQVIQRVNAVNASYAFADSLTIGAAVDLTPIVPTAQSQADIDFGNFSRWLQLTNALNSAKSLGWITGTEQVVLDAKAKVLALAVANIPRIFQ